MDARNYLKAIRRSWFLVVLSVIVALMIASAYLLVAPKTYSASAALLVTANRPQDASDAQFGLSTATNAAATYAQIIDSAAVLESATSQLPRRMTVDAALGMISATVASGTAVIDIQARGADRLQVADLANAAASSAVVVIPDLQGQTESQSPLTMVVIRSAAPPSTPISPTPRPVLTTGGALGLIAGLLLAILRPLPRPTQPRRAQHD